MPYLSGSTHVVIIFVAVIFTGIYKMYLNDGGTTAEEQHRKKTGERTLAVILQSATGGGGGGISGAGGSTDPESPPENNPMYRFPSGLMFRILRKGSGVLAPTVDTLCNVHYHAYVLSSYDEVARSAKAAAAIVPYASVGPNNGESTEVVAGGNTIDTTTVIATGISGGDGAQPISDSEEERKHAAEAATEEEEKKKKSGEDINAGSKMGTPPTGLVIKPPSTSNMDHNLLPPTPVSPFDSSYNRNEPLSLSPRQGIAAWMQSLPLMREGDQWELFVPEKLAYGAVGTRSGSVKPYSAVRYVLELVKVHTGGTRPAKAIADVDRLLMSHFGKTYAEM